MKMYVHIAPGSTFDGYDVAIISVLDGEKSSVMWFDDNGVPCFTQFGEYETLPRMTMRVSGPLARVLFPQLAKALQIDGRFPLDSEGTLRGKLEATEKHLIDMRHIVFKGAKP